MSVNRPLTGYRLVEIRHGDTLQELSARELGDAAKWATIIAINQLTPPYLTGDVALASDTVKMYGEMLLVPATRPSATAQTDPNAVFGVDLDLSGGLLHADAGDLRLIAGRANLRQSLSHRIKTRLKELLFHPSYGCGVHRLMGRVNGPTAGLLGAQYVRGAMLADDRVSSVGASIASPSGDILPISTTVHPIVGAPIEVTL